MHKALGFWAIPVMALVFGMVFLGCKNSKSSIEGTWINADVGAEEKIVFANGDMEQSYNNELYAKATYSLSEGTLTYTVTHLYGSTLFPETYEARWYTTDELITAVPEYYELFNEVFKPQTARYSIKDNELTITIQEETFIYIRE